MTNQFISRIRLSYRLFMDPRVSFTTKLIPIGILLYVFLPIDIIPDIPVIGWIDDIALMMGGMRLFESLVPEYILYEHSAALGIDRENQRSA